MSLFAIRNRLLEIVHIAAFYENTALIILIIASFKILVKTTFEIS